MKIITIVLTLALGLAPGLAHAGQHKGRLHRGAVAVATLSQIDTASPPAGTGVSVPVPGPAKR
jgi:hypothetical protein